MPEQSLRLAFVKAAVLKMNDHVSTAVAQVCSEVRHVQNHHGVVEVSANCPVIYETVCCYKQQLSSHVAV